VLCDDIGTVRRILWPVWRNAPFSLGVVGFAVLAAQVEFGFGGAWLANVDNKFTYDGILVLAALNCFICSRSRSDRVVWLWVGAAISAWTAGDIYYTIFLDGKANVPFPSLSDAGYLVFYPPVYVALVVLFHKEVRGIVRSLWLDGVIAALTTAALAASVVYGVVAHSLAGTGASSAAVATNLAYPLGDMLVLGIVVGAVALSGWRFSARWLLFGCGLAVFAVCDSVYLVEIAKNTYTYGTLLDLGWPAGMLMLAGAGTLPAHRVRAAQLDGYRLILVPALFGCVALTLEVIDHFRPLNPLGLTLTSLALCAVFVRMGMTFLDYLSLLERTRHESKTDLLTGLWNRRALVADLDETIESGTRSVLMLFDLNGFKSYNDRFGHPAGDALLARLGARLRDGVGVGGRAYRLGGDEFCVLVRIDTAKMADVVAATTANLTEEGDGFKITSSVGIVALPDEADDTTEALKIVDRRMYRHKGGDRPVGAEGRGALLGVLEARDAVLAAHTDEVVRLARAIADRIPYDFSIENVLSAAQLHDIGKVAVPDSILMKPGPLESSEWEVVRQHTLAGERIVGRVPGLDLVADAVRASHERWDGLGYPDGLSGHEIPLAARIVAVADAYAAMTTPDRPYRHPLSPAEAEAEVIRCAGSQFDPVVVEAFLAALAAELAPAVAA
jgi:two-component system cell cycle response regulator